MIADLSIHISDSALWFLAGFFAFPILCLVILMFVIAWSGDL